MTKQKEHTANSLSPFKHIISLYASPPHQIISKYSLNLLSSSSLPKECNPNMLSGARQSTHLLWVESQDGPEQSVRAHPGQRQKATQGELASHMVLEPKWRG